MEYGAGCRSSQRSGDIPTSGGGCAPCFVAPRHHRRVKADQRQGFSASSWWQRRLHGPEGEMRGSDVRQQGQPVLGAYESRCGERSKARAGGMRVMDASFRQAWRSLVSGRAGRTGEGAPEPPRTSVRTSALPASPVSAGTRSRRARPGEAGVERCATLRARGDAAQHRATAAIATWLQTATTSAGSVSGGPRPTTTSTTLTP